MTAGPGSHAPRRATVVRPRKVAHRRQAGSRNDGAPSVRDHLDRRGESNADLPGLISSLPQLDRGQLLLRWRNHLGGTPPAHLPTWLLMRVLAHRLQIAALGDLEPTAMRRLREAEGQRSQSFVNRSPTTREGADLKPGAMLAREWRGRLERVTVLKDGFAWSGTTYSSLSMVAGAITGTSWNGHRFFGLMSGRLARPDSSSGITDRAAP